MPKAKKSADSTVKKATRSRKEVVASSNAPAAATAPALESTPEWGNIEERIRVRAYELFQSRNGQNGSPESDWCQAEAEVRGALDRTA